MNKELFKEEIFNDSVIRTNLPLLFERLVRLVFYLGNSFILGVLCVVFLEVEKLLS